MTLAIDFWYGSLFFNGLVLSFYRYPSFPLLLLLAERSEEACMVYFDNGFIIHSITL
jgi:hypothetical protein